MVREDAERTRDPEGYVAAAERYEVQCDLYRQRLWQDEAVDQDAPIEEFIGASLRVFRKASELAAATGFPYPSPQTWAPSPQQGPA
jgi:hypothetical protein